TPRTAPDGNFDDEVRTPRTQSDRLAPEHEVLQDAARRLRVLRRTAVLFERDPQERAVWSARSLLDHVEVKEPLAVGRRRVAICYHAHSRERHALRVDHTAVHRRGAEALTARAQSRKHDCSHIERMAGRA